jgi:hypothetical protein
MLAFGPAIHANPVLRGANIFEALLLNFLVDKHILCLVILINII